MLITFKTESYADIVMFGEVAKKMLAMMNFGDSVPGAIVVDDVPKALDNLKAGLASQVEPVEPADTEDDEPRVSLHTRALPLIELLQSASREKNYVRWE